MGDSTEFRRLCTLYEFDIYLSQQSSYASVHRERLSNRWMNLAKGQCGGTCIVIVHRSAYHEWGQVSSSAPLPLSFAVLTITHHPYSQPLNRNGLWALPGV